MRGLMIFGASAFIALAGSSATVGATMFTFADPSVGAPPVFTYSGGILSGGWITTGLKFETPGVPVADFPDAKFTLTTPLITVLDMGIAKIMSGGQLDFFDSMDNPLLTITFSNAILTLPLSLGASDFIGSNVTFSGPVLGGQTFTNEAFAFSFANPVGNADQFTATAAFTSSADLVPAPGALGLAGAAALVGLRRRR